MADSNSDIYKIVCFDEGSATDFIQIVNGGSISVQESDERDSHASAEAHGSLSGRIGTGGILASLLGGKAEASVGASGEGSVGTSNVIKSIVTNTVLTDFLGALNSSEKEVVHKFEGYSIEPVENTLSSMALLTPYLSMLRGNQTVAAGDFNISLDKLDSTLSKAKGYLEFVGTKDDRRVIFRFNNGSLTNNYKVSDLLRMNLVIYAIKVGNTTLSDLNVNSELHVDPHPSKDNPDFPGNEESESVPLGDDILLDMYDVILAGVGCCA